MVTTNTTARSFRFSKYVLLASWVGTLSLGCSSSDSGGSPLGSGGHMNVGGDTGVGGTTAINAGGSNAAGSVSTGGVAPATGGVPAQGGNAPTGGSEAIGMGGVAPTGGNQAGGGTPNTGGAAAGGTAATGGSKSGGASSTGGSKSTGGATSAGGSQATGATKSTGGAPATGGSKATGGTPAAGGATGTGGLTGVGGTTSSSCGIPAYDAANPPTTLTLTGNLGTHDPVVILSNGVYYQYATGNGIGYKTSTNLTAWTGQPDVFSSIPAWALTTVGTDVTNIWAPDVSYFGGQFHLYYAVSTFGSKKSCIGHATRASLSTGSWTDHGSVICSNVGTSDNWNAIDPNVIVDDAGTPWLDFGSFWNGIMLTKLDSTGGRADTTAPQNIARNSSIEAPFIIHQCGYYYLFVSFGACCNGAYDYNMRVGRSTSVTGPYVDKAGTNMLNGGGTLLVQGNSTWHAPGHNAILITPNGAYNVYHALNSSNANPTLRISQLAMDAQGWPVSGGP